MINRHQYDLFTIEVKKRIRRSRIILYGFAFPFLGVATIFWVCKLFKIVPWWTPWPFIAVALGLVAYNHFNLKKSQKVLDKNQEFIDSL